MAVFLNIPVWKACPFFRLLLAFATGVVLHSRSPGLGLCSSLLLICSFTALLVFSAQRLSVRYVISPAAGLCVHLMMASCGYLITALNDRADEVQQLDQLMSQPAYINMQKPLFEVELKEPLIEKAATWKGLANIAAVHAGRDLIRTRIDVLVYLRKDSQFLTPKFGQRIAFYKTPEKIANKGMPADFDYVRYCALKNIHYRVFLNPSEFMVIEGNAAPWLPRILFGIRDWVIHVIRTYIPGAREAGLAEALLIGYKDDLDKSLTEAYTNTGVIHVVAISGLHLGLIYVILKRLTIPLTQKSMVRWLRPAVILSGLWLFSLLAGASPSVLRSAVMFSAIVLGESMSRHTSVYNNLAASALFLLCYNPNWLWDIGFQLSYAALLSILIFMKPIYCLYFTENKLLDWLWKLNAVTISAQVLTTPICIFYFHQFPNLFLITNLIAVPLSSIILIGEILLCLLSVFPAIANSWGNLLALLIRMMNGAIEWLAIHPFSTWTGLHVNFLQLLLLYLGIAFFSCWLLLQKKALLYYGLFTCLLFCSVRIIKIWQ